MAGEAREHFSGTVSDDIWYTVPRFDPDSVVHIPYGIKEAIFEDTAWASNSAKEAEADEQKREKDVEAGLEEDGDLPTDSKGSKKNKKHLKKDSKKDTKKDTQKDTKKNTKKENTKKENNKNNKKHKTKKKIGRRQIQSDAEQEDEKTPKQNMRSHSSYTARVCASSGCRFQRPGGSMPSRLAL